MEHVALQNQGFALLKKLPLKTIRTVELTLSDGSTKKLEEKTQVKIDKPDSDSYRGAHLFPDIACGTDTRLAVARTSKGGLSVHGGNAKCQD
jgi:hypothetical protein